MEAEFVWKSFCVEAEFCAEGEFCVEAEFCVDEGQMLNCVYIHMWRSGTAFR